MVSTVYDSLIYSMNPTVQKDAFSAQVQSDVEGTCGKVKSALSTLINVGGQVYELVSDTIDQAKKTEGAGINPKEVNFVPTCVENIFGEKYAGAVCGPEEVDDTSGMSSIVKEVGKKIIAQSDRKDLDFEITVKKDNSDINAYVIPGGKIVVTTGLLNEIYENSASVDDFKNRVSGTLGYLVARASKSQQVKQAQASGLFSLIGKVIKLVFGVFFPLSNAANGKMKVKLSPQEKKQQAVGKIIGHSLDLGEKILREHQINSSEKDAKELALKLTAGAGFEIDEEELDDTLETIFQEDESEILDEEIQESFSKIFPQVTKLFV